MSSIENRFSDFMLGLPSVEVIDDIEHSQDKSSKKADYLGMGRKVIFEQKCVTQDQTQKVQAYMDQFESEEWYPLFFGERDINQVLKYFPDPDEAKREVISRVTRLVEDYFKKANQQILATRQSLQILDAYGVLVVLNDSVPVLSPQLLAHRVQNRLLEVREDGSRRFDGIDMVVLISETHLFKGANRPILQVQGPDAPPPDVCEYLKYWLHAWGTYNGGRTEFVEPQALDWKDVKEKFAVPEGPIKRHEARRRWYQKYPYLRELSDDEVFEFGAKVFELTSPFLLNGGPQAPLEVTSEMALAFGDFVEETNHRGLDVNQLRRFVDDTKIRSQLDQNEK